MGVKMSKYSFFNIVENGLSLLYTKIFFPTARLIRRPIYIRGKKGIKYGAGFTTGHGCRIDATDSKVTLEIGEDARIGDYVHINADESVIIGKNVLIASKVFISDTNHGSYKGEIHSDPTVNPSYRELCSLPIFIGDNVWIGENAVVLAGSVIGNGCIIGANAVVNGGNYPDNTIIVGAPAKIIKEYDTIEKVWKKV